MKSAAIAAILLVGLAGTLACSRLADSILTGDGVDWRVDEDAAFSEARESGRHVIIDFGAEWCVPCKDIEEMLAESEISAEMTESFVPLRFDVTHLTERDEALRQKYRVFKLPAVLFVDAEGRELHRYSSREPSAEDFLAEMRQVLATHSLDR